MQLIKSSKHNAGPIRLALAAASASLLSGAVAQAEETPWLADSGLLVYSESGGRVQAIEPIVSLKKDMGDEHYLAMKFTFDSLTGATPNGAIPSKQTKTYTGPSGQKSYTTVVGALPLDDSFKDTRSAFNLSWDQPLGENNRVTVGGNFSHEYDFTSTGFNAAFARDFNDKNTTLSLGLGVESDTINAVGGIPTAFTSPITSTGNNADDSHTLNSLGVHRPSSDTKKVNDILLGVSQVINRYWLTQLNYSRSTSSGYQNDPYKILSVINSKGDTIDNANGESLLLYENRPTDRARQSIYWSNKIHISDMDIVDLSFRHYWDDWGVTAETLDLRYRIVVGSHAYFEPHLRYYTQTAADFYKPFLVSGSDVINGVSQIDYASSDPRLAKLKGTTIGLKWGYELGRNSEFNIRLEQYKQTGDSMPAEAKNMPALSGLNLYPGLTATTVMVGYSFEF
jgi:hypothetical protein